MNRLRGTTTVAVGGANRAIGSGGYVYVADKRCCYADSNTPTHAVRRNRAGQRKIRQALRLEPPAAHAVRISPHTNDSHDNRTSPVASTAVGSRGTSPVR